MTGVMSRVSSNDRSRGVPVVQGVQFYHHRADRVLFLAGMNTAAVCKIDIRIFINYSG